MSDKSPPSKPPFDKPAPSAFDALYADLAALPENRVGEIIDGVLYSFPRPASPHTKASSRLGGILGTRFDEDYQGDAGNGDSNPGGWVFLDEPELHIGGDVLVPGLAAWRRERMPVVPDVAFFTLEPDWVCEVLSPSTVIQDRKRKLPRYAAIGVAHVWLVDPAARGIEVYELVQVPDLGPRYAFLTAHVEDEVAAIPPFAALQLELARLWR